MSIFLWAYLSLIFLMSGLAVNYGNRVAFYFVLLLPFFLNLLFLFRKEKVFFPRKLTLIWFGFSLFDLISTILSSDKQLSIERFLLYQSLYLTAVYVYNKKTTFKPLIEKLIIIFSIIFTLAFVFKDAILKYPIYFDLEELFNFFHPAIKNNNHLGIWLGMVTILFISWKKIIPLIIFLPFFLISYSRTAFAGLFFVQWLRFYSLKKKHSLLLPIMIVMVIVFVLAVAILVPRDDVLSDRVYLYKEAILGFVDKPFFGYGSGNFTVASLKRSLESNGVANNNSHNIFLDVLSESGIFAFVFFVWFIYLILKKSNKSIDKSIFIYLLISATLSYINKMPAFMLLFFIFIGLSYEEKKSISLKRIIVFWVIILSFTSLYLGYSELLYYREDYEKSLKMYPYRKEVYEKLVSQIIYADSEMTTKYLDLYGKFFPGIFKQIIFSADTYKSLGDYNKALNNYVSLYKNGQGFNPDIVRNIHYLYLEADRPIRSYYFTKGFIHKVMSEPKRYRVIFDDTYELCIYINTFFLDKPACF